MSTIQLDKKCKTLLRQRHTSQHRKCPWSKRVPLWSKMPQKGMRCSSTTQVKVESILQDSWYKRWLLFLNKIRYCMVH